MTTPRQSTTAKSPTTIFKIVATILVATLLIYIHDAIPKGWGQVGKSSLRVFLYTVNAELRFLLVLFLLFWVAKGRVWRFSLVLPIVLTTYQLIIRLFCLQNTSYNEFDTKFVVTFLLAVALIVYYFKHRRL